MKMTSISNRALDTGEICRFCLSEDGKFVSIFKDDDLRDEDERLPVAARIMSITTVEVNIGDGLPELACQKCIEMLDQAFQFRDQVERSDAVLRHHYGRLWPETNPQLQKLLKEDQVVKKNLSVDFPTSENDQPEAACVVTLKQEQDEGNDESQSPNHYDDDYDEPQDYTMDDEDDDGIKLEPEDLTERPSVLTPPFEYLENMKQLFQEQQEPISLALRETQNTSVPKIQPSPLTIPNISVSLIRKNNIVREAQAQAQAQNQAQAKSRRWRKTNEPCTICGKCFKDRFAMKVHLRTHSGEKPFVCMVCGKAFRQKAHLGKHSYTHSAQRKQNQPLPIAPAPSTQRPQQSPPLSLSPNHAGSNVSSQSPVPSTYALDSADVKAKLARLSTIIQAKPAPRVEMQPITVPIPVFPRLQKQSVQGLALSPSRPNSPPSDQGSPTSPSEEAQTEPLALVPKTISPPILPKVIQPLLLPKPMLSVPQITPKAAHVNTPPSAVAYYVMANGLLPPNVVVGNGSGLKKT
ncbi:Ichor [Frankliniella fusca]|uniref:Ichor n=1 Tax=Frankliniella fusca TaxID=407009 RepID=A0AAE1LNW2_9NEOP|nr:Ichor [Frankliniella fusca]